MDEQEAERLNTDLLAVLRELAPWAADRSTRVCDKANL